ncbi:MAG TPA: hypothetical protein VGE13_02730 [Candidatus Saccharimonadales bacterium]
MDEVEQSSIISHAKDHKLLLMVFGSIAISTMLVMVALALYYSTGASQLDLSRPGYSDLREQVKNNDGYKAFSASGPIDEASLKKFDAMYTEQFNELKTIDAFNNDVLSLKSLQLE